ncbi:hypothetical protein N0V93_002690 [Gnomoniopsis smithogilvyi]|uniref:Uncharacterized protein n=1 Tax=Gnomoniopsis smithogilvyi TaxID=1191159 RepID=A0A9W9CZB0_9PEZI|nr:hypothetical protein N0V93_002690 [Gnomoniopsis smithogilvyi]
MFLNTLTLVLSLAGAVTPLPTHKRATGDIDLYAYGTGISGLELWGGSDGKAYIATSDIGQANSSLLQLIWASPSADSSWQVTQGRNGTTTTLTDFYIVTTSDAFEDCGFQGSNETAPSGASMTGFMKYGSQIIWSSGDDYVSQFWAQETETDGLYKLKWNSAGVDRADSVPVTIKTAAPES